MGDRGDIFISSHKGQVDGTTTRRMTTGNKYMINTLKLEINLTINLRLLIKDFKGIK